jgi:Ribosomal protein S6E (S10)
MLQIRRATEDRRVEAEEMIGEGQDIATGTVPPSLLYNLLHLPSRKRCPIPRKRQSLLSILPSPRENIWKRRKTLRGLTLCQESGIFEQFLQFKFMVWSKEHHLSFGSSAYPSYLDLAQVRLPLLQ